MIATKRPIRVWRTLRACALTLTCVLLVTVWFAGRAWAEELVFDARAGDEVERSIDSGDVHRYRVPLIERARLDLDLRAESGEVGKDGEDGSPPTLVVRDASGAERGRRSGFDIKLRIDAATSGTFEVLVESGSFSGGYELSIDADLRDVDVGGEVEVTNGPAASHLEAPLGASVRIDVRRRAGARPEIVAVRDGLGRDLGFVVKRSSKRRVRLHPIPVTAPGGITVVVTSADGAPGRYEVSLAADDDDDDSPDDDDDREEGKVVVQLAPGTDVQALAADLDLAFGWELEDVHDGFAVFEIPEEREGFEDADAREAAARFPEILDAEPDARAQTPEGTQSNGIVLGSSLGRSDFDGQPALGTVRAAKARKRATGRGRVVAVLDSGIDASHSLFVDSLLPGRDFVDDDADPSEERDGIDDDMDGEIDEGFGHGTFVAGLVLAAAPDVKILPVRVLDTDGRGRASDIAAGILYAHSQGADVINLSLGARSRSEVLRGAVRFALSHGIAVVASSGNGGDVVRADFPAGVKDVIAVTALDGGGRRAGFANTGGRGAISAPGVDLIGPFPDEQWGTWSGTSFSTALVSGGVALLRESKPTARLTRLLRLVRRRSRSFGRRIPRVERKLLGDGVLDLGRLAR